jgi:hypothetical protein
MTNFTLQLTNGIYLPSYRINSDHEDIMLKYLLEYLLEFIDVPDVRQKIKEDFDLDNMFNECKQTKAFYKIKNNHESLMKQTSTSIPCNSNIDHEMS